MRLNEKGKQEVRQLLESLLESIPDPQNDNQRVKLDKDLLDDLIFFKIQYQGEKLSKFPIWTGPFLRKLDLSELSFNDVVWDRQWLINDICYLGRAHQLPEDLVKQDKTIDFSYTNAKIEFSKDDYNPIANCNFEGIDLSTLTLYQMNFGEEEDTLVIKERNNFINTGVRIVDNNNAIMLEFEKSGNEYAQQTMDKIKMYIQCGMFDGCYYNGKKLKDGKATEIKAPSRKEPKQKAYEEYKMGIIKDVIEQITNIPVKKK